MTPRPDAPAHQADVTSHDCACGSRLHSASPSAAVIQVLLGRGHSAPERDTAERPKCEAAAERPAAASEAASPMRFSRACTFSSWCPSRSHRRGGSVNSRTAFPPGAPWPGLIPGLWWDEGGGPSRHKRIAAVTVIHCQSTTVCPVSSSSISSLCLWFVLPEMPPHPDPMCESNDLK